MQAVYTLHSDELNENFIAAINAQFAHQTIEIAISKAMDVGQDEILAIQPVFTNPVVANIHQTIAIGFKANLQLCRLSDLAINLTGIFENCMDG